MVLVWVTFPLRNGLTVLQGVTCIHSTNTLTQQHYYIMAKFNQLAMSSELLSNKNLRVVSSMMGLSKKLVYVPTGATVSIKKYNYNAEASSHLLRVIDSDGKGLAASIKACHAQPQAIGNLELDACVSTDKQFAALQLLQFSDYTYHPISKVATFEGEQAQLVASIL